MHGRFQIIKEINTYILILILGVILNISAYGRRNETKTQEMIYETIVIRPPHPRVDMSRVLVKLYPRASLELR